MNHELLEKLCKKPNNLRILLVLPEEGGVRQLEVSHMKLGGVSQSAFYGALKDLLSLGLIRRYKKDDVYWLELTEKGKLVRELLLRIEGLLGE